MNELQLFNHPEFGGIRCIEINSEPWMVGKDVATALGYQNPSKALIDHVDDEDKLNNETLSSLGQRGGWLINESGLYSLVLSSKLPGAKKFRRWVTSEVLPAIRKHGCYIVPTSPAVKRRELTTDDYLKAASLVANCRNERLSYVLGFLEKGGFEIAQVESTKPPEPELAQIINMAIGEYGFTADQIGNLVGINRVQVYRYKNGALPRGDRAARIIQAVTDAIAQIDLGEN